jgi:hypothetical protein
MFAKLCVILANVCQPRALLAKSMQSCRDAIVPSPNIEPDAGNWSGVRPSLERGGVCLHSPSCFGLWRAVVDRQGGCLAVQYAGLSVANPNHRPTRKRPAAGFQIARARSSGSACGSPLWVFISPAQSHRRALEGQPTGCSLALSDRGGRQNISTVNRAPCSDFKAVYGLPGLPHAPIGLFDDAASFKPQWLRRPKGEYPCQPKENKI